ncbi:toll/interleukin-1 receptor domain-containing protein [Rubricoccus marinus]|uniref:TIR domain-containing protein n=1 Tax=Rubricoccus marinus TaxID=716817 RepID=A0A259TUT4_9BACT|nr:toll/interleukin-1 receptor domain-containing protein [Rubricoccus marinus]OZC01456.1 hypothetical protein BSZ36_17420 [Rubricoccus marinus]
MASYLSDTSLRARSIKRYDPDLKLESSPGTSYSSVFLSHSHLDKDLVEGLVDRLARLGVRVYVDWKDATLPASPSRDTVETIKKQIVANDVFMLLATDRALESKWVPWELGVADQAKGYDRIVVVPVTRNGTYLGSEYVRVYRQLREELGSLKIFGPGGSGTGSAASNYLRGKAAIFG